MRRYSVLFEGRVQGVGFRYRTTSIAKRYTMTGWVKNLPDGRVQLEAESKPWIFQKFLKELVDSMGNNISNYSVEECNATSDFDRFETRY
jgi:acylphosphatase